MGLDAMIIFWMLSFKPVFPLSSFTFIERLFNSSSLSVIRVVLSAYLRLLLFLLAILIPACASPNPAFHMMYSAYKLSKQSDKIQPWCTLSQFWTSPLFHVWFCCFLTCIEVSQETSKVVWYSHFFMNFLQLLLFSQLFVRLPKTTILPFCIPFPWGWFWSQPPVQCYKPPSIVLQALYQI